MPIVIIKQFAGRSLEQKKAMADLVTRGVREIYGPTAQPVQVLFEEIAADDWFSEGTPVVSIPRIVGGRSE